MREFIIADNQDITKAGMMFLLSSQKDTALLLEADNKAELVQQLRLHPQAVVILDYTLFDFSGADELIVLHERFKEADWLLFSDELSMEFLRQVLFSSMAFGVVLKDNSKEEILSALQCASRKERFICNHVSNLLLSGSNASPVRHTLKDDLLTPAERSVLKEIALGKTTKEIAAEKNLSFHTVNSHRKNIFRKLGVNNVHEATKYAMKAGIVDLDYSNTNLSTADTYSGSFIIYDTELSGSNTLQIFRRYNTIDLPFPYQFSFHKFRCMADFKSYIDFLIM